MKLTNSEIVTILRKCKVDVPKNTNALHAALLTNIMKCSRDVLVHIAKKNDIPTSGTKNKLVKAILKVQVGGGFIEDAKAKAQELIAQGKAKAQELAQQAAVVAMEQGAKLAQEIKDVAVEQGNKVIAEAQATGSELAGIAKKAAEDKIDEVTAAAKQAAKDKMAQVIGGRTAHKLRPLGKNGYKLREDLQKVPASIEFLCVGCRKQTRVKRSSVHLTLKKLPNGAYLMQGAHDCVPCKKSRAVNKIVSKVMAEKLINAGVKMI